jgi:hypothetical protein
MCTFRNQTVVPATDATPAARVTVTFYPEWAATGFTVKVETSARDDRFHAGVKKGKPQFYAANLTRDQADGFGAFVQATTGVLAVRAVMELADRCEAEGRAAAGLDRMTSDDVLTALPPAPTYAYDPNNG